MATTDKQPTNKVNGNLGNDIYDLPEVKTSTDSLPENKKSTNSIDYNDMVSANDNSDATFKDALKFHGISSGDYRDATPEVVELFKPWMDQPYNKNDNTYNKKTMEAMEYWRSKGLIGDEYDDTIKNWKASTDGKFVPNKSDSKNYSIDNALEIAAKNGINAATGKTEKDGYKTIFDIHQEMADKKQSLDDAKNANSSYIQNVEDQNNVKKNIEDTEKKLKQQKKDEKNLKVAQKNYEKGLKKGRKSVSSILESKIHDKEKDISDFEDYQNTITNKSALDKELSDFEQRRDNYISNPDNPIGENTWENWDAKSSAFTQKGQELTDKINGYIEQYGEDFLNDPKNLDALKNELTDFANQAQEINNGSIDVLTKVLASSGDPKDQELINAINNSNDLINQLQEKQLNNVTPETLDGFKKQYEQLTDLQKQIEQDDSNIVNAQAEYDNSKAKFMYYLLDGLKSFMVFYVGLTAGNFQMVYSALDNYNASIAKAETAFKTDMIGAYSKNNVKNITGQTDADYTRIQNEADLEKYLATKGIDSKEAVREVEALKEAFEQYKKDSAGSPDFQAFYTSKMLQNNGGSGWSGAINNLIQAGSLNWETIMNVLKGGNTGSDVNEKMEIKPLSYGKNKSGSWLNSAFENAKNRNEVANVDPKVTKDKQNTVNNVLQSKLGAQGAPQTQPLQQNPGWGNTTV